MKTAYTFSVLRYVHDPVTAEFVNIGVALYAADCIDGTGNYPIFDGF